MKNYSVTHVVLCHCLSSKSTSSCQNLSSQKPVKRCPVGIDWGVQRASVKCISGQWRSSRLKHPLLLYFVLFTISRVPSRCSLNTALQDLLLHMFKAGEGLFLPPQALPHHSELQRGCLGQHQLSACAKTAAFPTGLQIQLFYLHPNKSLMLPHSWILALVGE